MRYATLCFVLLGCVIMAGGCRPASTNVNVSPGPAPVSPVVPVIPVRPIVPVIPIPVIPVPVRPVCPRCPDPRCPHRPHREFEGGIRPWFPGKLAWRTVSYPFRKHAPRNPVAPHLWPKGV